MYILKINDNKAIFYSLASLQDVLKRCFRLSLEEIRIGRPYIFQRKNKQSVKLLLIRR